MTKEEKSVVLLDIFTKTWCANFKGDDLDFECKRCEFELSDGTCSVKRFKNRILPDYKGFGSMIH